MKKFGKQLLFIVLITLCSCVDNIDFSKQRILFSVQYVNYAWSYTNNGFMVDSAGNVCSYNLSENSKWNNADSLNFISEEDMNENLSLCTRLSEGITKDTLQYYINKINAARKGKLIESDVYMADAGIKQYWAYVYDADTKKYKQILLNQWGDVQITNSAYEASEITQWLNRILNSTVWKE
jgi:hypothetical protein